MFRYERREGTLISILDNVWTLYECVSEQHLKGFSVLYKLMEYHLDPELA